MEIWKQLGTLIEPKCYDKNNMKETARFEILLEHIAKDIRTVAEGHISLDQKISQNQDEARQMNRNTNNKLDIIAQTLAGKIDKNREAIEMNREAIEMNREAIEMNREAIEMNREAIEMNRGAIEMNREAIEINCQEIGKNRKKIEGVDNKLSAGLKKFADYDKRIKLLEVIN